MSITLDINELLTHIKETQGDGTYTISMNDYDQIEFTTLNRSTGYYVSNDLGGSTVQLGDTLEAHTIGIYRTALATEIFKSHSKTDAYLGIWTDPKTDKVYYDVTRHYVSEAVALCVAIEENQIAYYDIANGEAVNTPK